MLLIKGRDLGTRPRIMTVNHDGNVTNVRIFEPEPSKGEFAGKLIASFQLTEHDAAELKRMI